MATTRWCNGTESTACLWLSASIKEVGKKLNIAKILQAPRAEEPQGAHRAELSKKKEKLPRFLDYL